MKARRILTGCILVAVTLLAMPLFAQPGPPPPGAGAPVDGGAAALVIGAAVFGYRRLKKKEHSED